MRGAHPNMRMHHPGANNQQQPISNPNSSKSIVTLALPMYTVGIGIFFIYTCCKVCVDEFLEFISICKLNFSIGQRRISMSVKLKNID
jgi:hypothetical protein